MDVDSRTKTKRTGKTAKKTPLTLSAYFSIYFVLTFIIASILIIAIVNQSIRKETLSNAREKTHVLLERNLATHHYFSQQLKPKLFGTIAGSQSEDYFEPTWMSSTYAIREIDKYFNANDEYGEYYYKECAVNARSPQNEADEYEKTFIEKLNKDPNLSDHSEIRTIDGLAYFVTLHKGEMMEQSCLKCHSTPDNAPGDLVTQYGPERSFGRNAGDAVSAISIRIPLANAYAATKATTIKLSILLLSILVLILSAHYLFTKKTILLRTSELANLNRQLVAEMSKRKNSEAKVRDQKVFLEQVIESLSYPFYVIDADDYTIKLANSAAGPQELAKQTTCHALTHNSQTPCNDTEHICPVKQIKQTKKAVTVEHIHYDKHGKARNVEVHAHPVLDEKGNVVQIIEYCLDITERKKAREHLEIAKEHAEAASIAKSQFLANMSHEIRTPISVITGFSNILISEELTKSQLTYVELIRNAGKSLLTIINDILDYSKIEAGKLKIAPAEHYLSEILDDIDTMMRPLADKKNLNFEVICSKKLPDIIQTDYDRLHQCLVNLVNNAIKFTNAGYVHINVSKEGNEKEFIRFDIEDTGIGIPIDSQEHLFDSFTQVEKGSTRKYGGTGLGLAITSKLAQLLGGELTFISHESKGSTFSLLIPTGNDIALSPSVQKRKDFSKTLPPKQDPPPYSGSALIAEDDKSCQLLMTEILERMGLKTTTADDGRQAVEKCADQPFDLIFMDVRMPKLNGLKATKILRDNGINIPIIALTAHAMEGDRELCINAGCNEYLSKPIDHSQLNKILGKHLQEKQLTANS